MVLTNMLPNQGNGTLRVLRVRIRCADLSAFGRGCPRDASGDADDDLRERQRDETIRRDDTPTQGGIASGTSFVNFGWTLTPQPKLIPLDGSTITVLVDGEPLGTVSYNHERPDIEGLFPGFQNTTGTNGAIGFRVIDTTTLTNGLHTISWTVADDQGAVEGIGSRFFTVSNGVAGLTAEGTASSTASRPPPTSQRRRTRRGPMLARRGWNLAAPWQWVGVGSRERAVIRGEEIDRFEVALGEHAGARYTGYLRTSDGLAPLPIGSRLDATMGIFTWAPGVGFVGSYDLVFVRCGGGQRGLAAGGADCSGAEGERIARSAGGHRWPRSQQDVAQPFALGGWAADLSATDGTGIATLHAWAYPLAGGPPVFLGAASYGGARPDVAAVHGDHQLRLGFRARRAGPGARPLRPRRLRVEHGDHRLRAGDGGARDGAIVKGFTKVHPDCRAALDSFSSRSISFFMSASAVAAPGCAITFFIS